MKKIPSALVLAFVLLCHPILAQTTNPNQFQYRTDITVIKEVGEDLYSNLKPTFRSQISPHPIWLKEELAPVVRPALFQEQNRVVYISTGFIRLANSIAHAKAIDKIEPGFFEKYTVALSQQASEHIVPELPEFGDPRYWTDDVMNEQLSYFNQIIGAVAAINLAHHYLGHFDKYFYQLKDSAINPVTMASTCTLGEWQQAMKLGAANALDCGLGFDGLKAFLDCIDKMPKRPGWTLYYMPYTAKLDVAKIKNQLTDIENLFFGQVQR